MIGVKGSSASIVSIQTFRPRASTRNSPKRFDPRVFGYTAIFAIEDACAGRSGVGNLDAAFGSLSEHR